MWSTLPILLGLVLVGLSYCNKMPQTGWITNNRNLILTVWGAQKSKIKSLRIQGVQGIGEKCKNVSFLFLVGQEKT